MEANAQQTESQPQPQQLRQHLEPTPLAPPAPSHRPFGSRTVSAAFLNESPVAAYRFGSGGVVPPPAPFPPLWAMPSPSSPPQLHQLVPGTPRFWAITQQQQQQRAWDDLPSPFFPAAAAPTFRPPLRLPPQQLAVHQGLQQRQETQQQQQLPPQQQLRPPAPGVPEKVSEGGVGAEEGSGVKGGGGCDSLMSLFDDEEHILNLLYRGGNSDRDNNDANDENDTDTDDDDDDETTNADTRVAPSPPSASPTAPPLASASPVAAPSLTPRLPPAAEAATEAVSVSPFFVPSVSPVLPPVVVVAPHLTSVAAVTSASAVSSLDGPAKKRIKTSSLKVAAMPPSSPERVTTTTTAATATRCEGQEEKNPKKKKRRRRLSAEADGLAASLAAAFLPPAPKESAETGATTPAPLSPPVAPAHQEQMSQGGNPATAPASATAAMMANGKKSIDDAVSLDQGPSTEGPSPQEHFNCLLRSRGYSTRPISYIDAGCQQAPTPLQLSSYGTAVLDSLKNPSPSPLALLLASGLSPNPCNKFQDSVLCISAKRCRPDLIRAQLEAGASVRTADDFGRTPLHHACWAVGDNLESAACVLDAEPELMRVADRSGRTPLAYLSRGKWGSWIAFLEGRMEQDWPIRVKDEEDATSGSRRRPLMSAPPRDPEGALSPDTAAMVSSGAVNPKDAHKLRDGTLQFSWPSLPLGFSSAFPPSVLTKATPQGMPTPTKGSITAPTVVGRSRDPKRKFMGPYPQRTC